MVQNNVQHLADTEGTIRSTSSLFSGQDQTRFYNDRERDTLVNADRGERTFGQHWDDQPTSRVVNSLDLERNLSNTDASGNSKGAPIDKGDYENDRNE